MAVDKHVDDGVHWDVRAIEMPVNWDLAQGYLKAGWEPFSVTNNSKQTQLLWLRKQVDDNCDLCRAEAARLPAFETLKTAAKIKILAGVA